MNILLLIGLIHAVGAQLNLYLDSVTVQQLYELNEHQLYFVSENRVRQSALESAVPVPADIDFVQVTWNVERPRAKLHYQYNTSSENERVLLRPVLNIDETGVVPREVTTFSIFFPCLSSNRINCSVFFRFSNSTAKSPSSSSLTVQLKFNKHCRDQMIDRSLLNEFYKTSQISEYLHLTESRYRDFASTTLATILAYSLVIALVVFVLVFCTAMSLFCLYRMSTTKSSKSENLINDNQDHPALPMTFDMTTFEDVSLYSCTQYDFIKTADELLSSATFADCTIDPNRVMLQEVILEGKFGRLLHCSLSDSSGVGPTQSIYGKTLNACGTPAQLSEMLHDCCLFATLKHANVNSPLGIVHKDELAPYPLIVYPYSKRGILKRLLVQNRASAREQLLSTQELVYMAIHVAKGLYFLHKRKMLMKDIGTRNCLVMDDLTVKLTDYALSRDLFPQDYDSLPTDMPGELRPLKFMAMESISDRRFSTASDVWSFGVLLWELMSRGSQPYADVEPTDFIDHLQSNHRLVQPMNCPDALFKLMSICWIASIDQRPSMNALLRSLMEFYSQLSRFI